MISYVKLIVATESLLRLDPPRSTETEALDSGLYVCSAGSSALSLCSCYPVVTDRRLTAVGVVSAHLKKFYFARNCWRD